MPFQQPTTIVKALRYISKNEYVLPAIQREFVWDPEQICRLFDSIMRGYPFGSFLFWRVDRKSTRDYTFYQFVTNFHRRDAPHCAPLQLTGEDPVTAVLDGQQRLTALNIGLRGSHADKLPRMRWSSPGAFPKRRLYLDVRSEAGNDELDLKYSFSFLNEARAASENAAGKHHWFPVSEVMDMHEGGPDINDYLVKHELASKPEAFRLLFRLHRIVHTDLLINYFEEEEQNLDKVLNIFIRVNSGGTVLSYADLLLSVATAQWKQRDAREEIHGIVDEINRTGQGFRFPKDLVLKAALMLTDISEVQFKVTNFTADNMAMIETRWNEVTGALSRATRLLADVGFSDENLTANNVLLPVAYYFMARRLDDSFLTSKASAADREAIRLWVVRTLVKRGVWGSGLDTLLKTIRAAIRTAVDQGAKEFPTTAVEAAMRERGKALVFDDEELDALLETRYQDKSSFALLSLLYSGESLRNKVHIDHVFPRTLVSKAKLQKAGFGEVEAEELSRRVDQLPNLQLMEGTINQQKSSKLPNDWLREHFATDTDRGYYIARHELGELPEGATEFESFLEARRQRMKERLAKLLGVTKAAPLPDADT